MSADHVGRQSLDRDSVWTRPIAGLVLAQCLVWGAIPLAFVSSLHQDTLEIIYWGRELAFGYFKHPPLPTWVLDLIVRPNGAPIAVVLLIGVVCVAVTAAYIFSTVRLFAPESAAALAVAAYLAARSATYLSLQVNHNSILIPFWAALAFHGYRFLERRRAGDAIAAGVAAGLGALVKYEILLLLEGMLIVVAFVPKYRTVVRDWRTYAAAGVALAIVSPHLVWLVNNRHQSIEYAIDNRNITGFLDALDSLNHLVVGHALILIGPALALGATRLAGWRPQIERDSLRFALLAGFGPSLALVVMSIFAMQIIRDGWIDPLTPSFAIGLGIAMRLDLVGARDEAHAALARTRFAAFGIALAALQLLAFFLLLVVRARLDSPVAAYDLDAKGFARQVEAYWNARHDVPLHCLIAGNHLVPAEASFVMAKRPHVVDLGSPGWSRPEQMAACVKTGGVAALQDTAMLDRIPAACAGSGETIRVASPLSNGRAGWTLTLYDVPPGGCGAAKP